MQVVQLEQDLLHRQAHRGHPIREPRGASPLGVSSSRRRSSSAARPTTTTAPCRRRPASERSTRASPVLPGAEPDVERPRCPRPGRADRHAQDAGHVRSRAGVSSDTPSVSSDTALRGSRGRKCPILEGAHQPGCSARTVLVCSLDASALREPEQSRVQPSSRAVCSGQFGLGRSGE
jgi:hypothetical protein